ncbi:MAG TPA: hypothetical protein ENK12_07585 [Gammaproteobacteria bacterium]|nr:hypothetical protein [Gammaproteobacteria bacterium]
MKNPTRSGHSFAAGLLLAGAVNLPAAAQAGGNPFAFTDLAAGYRLAQAEDGKQGKDMDKEGKCGGKSAREAVCGIYQVGSGHKDPARVKDGKCGGHKVVEALCGGDR